MTSGMVSGWCWSRPLSSHFKSGRRRVFPAAPKEALLVANREAKSEDPRGGPKAEKADRIRAADAILNRGLGKVAEFPEENRQTFQFFRPLTEAQIAEAERMVQALPANTDGNPNGNGPG